MPEKSFREETLELLASHTDRGAIVAALDAIEEYMPGAGETPLPAWHALLAVVAVCAERDLAHELLDAAYDYADEQAELHAEQCEHCRQQRIAEGGCN